MPVRIESKAQLSVGDQVEHEGANFVVTEAAVWSDALDNYVHTEALLEPVGGDDGGHPD